LGYLGSANRVVYESKNFVSGLTGVAAAVIKPDNSIAGPYALMELPAPFSGRYYFDFITTLSSPTGEYVIMIVSPSENIQTTKTISIYQDPAASIEMAAAAINAAATSITAVSVQLSNSNTQLISTVNDLAAEVVQLTSSLEQLQAVSAQILENSQLIANIIPLLETISSSISSVLLTQTIEGVVTDNEAVVGDSGFGDLTGPLIP
jgi:hypothetical protein